MKFYNPKTSSFEASLSVFKGTLQIIIAPTLDPNFTGQPKKGQKIYDQDGKVFFSISPIECDKILTEFSAIVAGTYKNPEAKDARYESTFGLVHYNNNQPSRLLLSAPRKGSLTITVLSSDKKKATYTLRPEELRQFKFMLENVTKNLEYDCAFANGLAKIQNYKSKNTGGSSIAQSDDFSGGGDNVDPFDNSSYGGNSGDNTPTSGDHVTDADLDWNN